MKAARLDPATLLVRSLIAHARGLGVTVRAESIGSRPWVSATFEGERVAIELSGLEGGAGWLANLPEAELPVRGHIVADLTVGSRTAGTVRLEALLIRAV